MEDTCARLLREGRHQGVLPRHQGSGRARRAALEEEEDMAIDDRDDSGSRDRGSDARIEIEGCDTIPELFWHRRRGARRPHGLCARRSSASGARMDAGASTASACARSRHGPVALGLAAAATRRRSWPTPCSNGSTPTWASCAAAASPTASIRPTRPRRSSTSCNDIAHPLPVRRERRAARQGRSRCATRCPSCVKIVVFDMEGLRDFRDPQVMPLRRAAARSAARYDAAHPEPVGAAASRARRPERPGDPGLHLGHHRPAQGRDAVATATSSSSSRYDDAFIPLRRRTTSSCASCRCATSPSAPSRVFLPLHTGAIAQLRREPRDRAREHPRGGAHRLLRRAAHLGEVLFRRGDPHEGGDLARPRRLPVGASASGCKVAERASSAGRRPSPALRAALHAVADWLVLDNIKRVDRHAPRALRRHRRGADRARPDQVVPGARRRHARGLRPDRELRRSPPACRRPHQARHRRRRRARTPRCRISPDGRDPARGPHVFMGYLQPAGEDRRDADATAGCTPATSGVIDNDGYLRITDRMKDIIITAGGKNITPSRDREPAQVLALHLRRGGDRRQAQVPLVPDHDRPRERREVRPGPQRAVHQLRLAVPGAARCRT